MFRRLVKIIYNLLSIFDYIFRKFFKKKIFLVLKELIEEKSYEKIKINNNDIFFFCPNDLISWRIQTFYTKEPETLEWINNFTSYNEKIIFWDIGANIGLYSIYAANKFKNINIKAFEPSTSNLRILSRNISINNLYEKISINQIALSDKSSLKSHLLRESSFLEGSALHSFKENINFEGEHINSENCYKILGLSADEYFEYFDNEIPNYIKIDVDGLEHLILKGGEKILQSQNLKSICIEINENFKEQKNQIEKIMQSNKFNLMFKKHSDLIDIGEKFINSYNYFYSRN